MVNTQLVVGWSLEVRKRLVLSEKNDWLDFDEQMQKLKRKTY